MATIEELETQFSELLNIDSSRIDYESSRTPNIHNTVYRHFNREALLLKRYEQDLSSLLLDRFEFYTGKCDPLVYQTEPLDKTILKVDVDRYIDGDKKVIAQRLKVEGQKQKVKYIESVIKEISQRRWDIRSTIDFLKFKNGIS